MGNICGCLSSFIKNIVKQLKVFISKNSLSPHTPALVAGGLTTQGDQSLCKYDSKDTIYAIKLIVAKLTSFTNLHSAPHTLNLIQIENDIIGIIHKSDYFQGLNKRNKNSLDFSQLEIEVFSIKPKKTLLTLEYRFNDKTEKKINDEFSMNFILKGYEDKQRRHFQQ